MDYAAGWYANFGKGNLRDRSLFITWGGGGVGGFWGGSLDFYENRGGDQS